MLVVVRSSAATCRIPDRAALAVVGLLLLRGAAAVVAAVPFVGVLVVVRSSAATCRSALQCKMARTRNSLDGEVPAWRVSDEGHVDHEVTYNSVWNLLHFKLGWIRRHGTILKTFKHFPPPAMRKHVLGTTFRYIPPTVESEGVVGQDMLLRHFIENCPSLVMLSEAVFDQLVNLRQIALGLPLEEDPYNHDNEPNPALEHQELLKWPLNEALTELAFSEVWRQLNSKFNWTSRWGGVLYKPGVEQATAEEGEDKFSSKEALLCGFVFLEPSILDLPYRRVTALADEHERSARKRLEKKEQRQQQQQQQQQRLVSSSSSSSASYGGTGVAGTGSLPAWVVVALASRGDADEAAGQDAIGSPGGSVSTSAASTPRKRQTTEASSRRRKRQALAPSPAVEATEIELSALAPTPAASPAPVTLTVEATKIALPALAPTPATSPALVTSAVGATKIALACRKVAAAANREKEEIDKVANREKEEIDKVANRKKEEIDKEANREKEEIDKRAKWFSYAEKIADEQAIIAVREAEIAEGEARIKDLMRQQADLGLSKADLGFFSQMCDLIP